jgi:glycosyltransferase involved in cell wall biosynthesis
MASGLAVIGFNSAAAADLLRNGDNGFVVALGDDAAFAGAVCACAAMTATALARMRAQARATALNLGWDNVLGGFERRLEQIAAARAVEGLGHVVTA